MFYAPCAVWRILHGKSGLQLAQLMDFANDSSNIRPQSRVANLHGMSAHLSSVFLHRYRLGAPHPQHRHRIVRFLNLHYYEAYLTLLYLGLKVAFLVNIFIQVCSLFKQKMFLQSPFFLQLYVMNWFLQTDEQTVYGWSVLLNVLHGIRKYANYGVCTQSTQFF